jgi:outer membrane protein OmpA-like peptidoglycan-associated protein
MDRSTHWLRYDPKGDFPKKFTVEFDADMGGEFSIFFTKPPNWGGDFVTFDEDSIRTHNVRSAIKPFGPVVKRVSISVNGTYVKVYVGGARILQDPEAVKRPLTRLGIQFHGVGSSDWDRSQHLMLTAFRLAEGGKDVTQALNSEGRIVVHGIYFDTGSDVIKPESGGALRNILQLLNDDPALLFVIEGHTDNQGGPTVNGPLSEKRAAAVKAWLVSQGIDAKRLGTKGMGATKPIDGNETQEGRAMNRRVEFVKVSRIATAP